MEKLNSPPSEKVPPEHLYHYTSINGLEGILTKRAIWASQIHFLNDTQEFKYAVQVLKEALSELRNEYPITSIQRALGPNPLPSEQKELLAQFYQSIGNNIILDLFEKFTEKCLVEFIMGFSQIASILKHPSFYEECEWRIVSNFIENRHMSFRVGKSMLIPYFLISFEGIEPFPIDAIIIGPTSEQGLAKSSLFQFLLQNKLNISIETSKTPYRIL